MSLPQFSITEMFRRLRAPLANPMWSWGAVREADNTVFLRVWQDQEQRIDGRWFTKITHHAYFADKLPNLGWQERLQQVDRIRSGARCYLIMCEAKDPKASPRSIGSFNSREVFTGGELREIDGDWWVERAGRVAARELMGKG